MTNLYVLAIKQLEIDMNNGSLEAAHTLCAEMWNEIVETGNNNKHETTVGLNTNMQASCDYCHYSTGFNCMNRKCPLLSVHGLCELYALWESAITAKEAKFRAKAIADIACAAE